MNDKFYKLPEEKQNAIINGAMSVFARYGYKKASTDEIVIRAGISKGLLFHYFGSKQGLYLFLYSYARDFLLAEMSRDYDKNETDFFQMLINAQLCKLAILRRHSDLMTFLSNAFIETDPAVESALDSENNSVISISRAAILSRADASKFKAGVSMERTLDMILWMSEGLMRSRMHEQSYDLEAINEEYLKCLAMLRQNLYREAP